MLEICSKMFLACRTSKKTTYGLGFKLTLTRNEDNVVLQKVVALAARKKLIISPCMYPNIHLPINNKVFCPNNF